MLDFSIPLKRVLNEIADDTSVNSDLRAPATKHDVMKLGIALLGAQVATADLAMSINENREDFLKHVENFGTRVGRLVTVIINISPDNADKFNAAFEEFLDAGE
ncbi:hypothetical protein [Novosphingobium sp. fls2-241-R2A-195]|uniref:hypothetical protein n=1 Tax=Novosphingobium sp. fls2-241-R2A-195 TaxID=3040296 RepID=UPI00254D29EF|nr:hypothetical protein [Novosphingobium sp. fls2-241-R2A-195]